MKNVGTTCIIKKSTTNATGCVYAYVEKKTLIIIIYNIMVGGTHTLQYRSNPLQGIIKYIYYTCYKHISYIRIVF